MSVLRMPIGCDGSRWSCRGSLSRIVGVAFDQLSRSYTLSPILNGGGAGFVTYVRACVCRSRNGFQRADIVWCRSRSGDNVRAASRAAFPPTMISSSSWLCLLDTSLPFSSSPQLIDRLRSQSYEFKVSSQVGLPVRDTRIQLERSQWK